jgi:hypothetical protein
LWPSALALAMLASVVATLARIIPDPVQAHLGIHRVRLIRQPGKIALIDGRCPRP